jgi:hypothetical protein
MQASTELMSESIKFLPQDVTQALQLQADLMNIPKIGSDKNFLCHSMQVNVSPAKAAGDGEHHITTCLFLFLTSQQRNTSQSLLGYLGDLTLIDTMPQLVTVQ